MSIREIPRSVLSSGFVSAAPYLVTDEDKAWTFEGGVALSQVRFPESAVMVCIGGVTRTHFGTGDVRRVLSFVYGLSGY